MAHEAKTDKIYMLLQRGDTVLAPGKHPNLRIWDGMVGYLDPYEWQSKVIFSDYWLGETCVIELPRVWKQVLLEAVKPYESAILGANGLPIIGDATKRARGYVDITSIAPAFWNQVPDFLTKYYKHKGLLPVIDGSALPLSVLLDTKGVDFTKRALRDDVGQITAGTHTVGPGAADYPTWGGVGGARAAYGNLTDDMNIVQVGNVVNAAVAVGLITFNGFTLTEESDNPHYGDPTAGWACTYPNNVHGFDTQFEGAGNLIFRNLFPSYANVQAAADRYLFNLNAVVVAFTAHIYNNLMNQNGNRGGCFLGIDNTPIIYVFNNGFYNASNGAGGVGMGGNSANGNSIYANNFSWNNQYNYSFGFQAFMARNNTAFDNAGVVDYFRHNNMTGRHNVSTDASAADVNWGAGLNNIANEPALNCVQSVNPGLATFMDILLGGTLDGSGEANNVLLGRTRCLRDRPVPGPGGTSRGPAEIPSAGRHPLFDRTCFS
jgi:hypothetical protein